MRYIIPIVPLVRVYGHTAAVQQYRQRSKNSSTYILYMHDDLPAMLTYLRMLWNPQRLHLSSLSWPVAGRADFLLLTDAPRDNPHTAAVFLSKRCVRDTILNLLHNLRFDVNSQPLASRALARLFFRRVGRRRGSRRPQLLDELALSLRRFLPLPL